MQRTIALTLILAIAACTKTKPDPAQAPEPSKLYVQLLQPLLLKEQPPADQLKTVIDVRTNAKDGDEVVVQGRVPPESLKPFLVGLAGFTLMAAEDLDNPEIKEEFECDDAAT